MHIFTCLLIEHPEGSAFRVVNNNHTNNNGNNETVLWILLNSSTFLMLVFIILPSAGLYGMPTEQQFSGGLGELLVVVLLRLLGVTEVNVS